MRIKTCTEFLNEKLIFFSDYGDIVDKICKYALTMPIGEIRTNHDNNEYSFTIRTDTKKRPEDPYGEENWGENLEIRVNKVYTVRDIFTYDYNLIINNEKVEASTFQAKRLFNIIKKRFKYRERDEANAERKARKERMERAFKDL